MAYTPSQGTWPLNKAKASHLPGAALAQSTHSRKYAKVPCIQRRISSRSRHGPCPAHPHMTSFLASSNPKLLLPGTNLSLIPFLAFPTPQLPFSAPDWGWGFLFLSVLHTSGQDQ